MAMSLRFILLPHFLLVAHLKFLWPVAEDCNHDLKQEVFPMTASLHLDGLIVHLKDFAPPECDILIAFMAATVAWLSGRRCGILK
jgi:hypothetical protein